MVEQQEKGIRVLSANVAGGARSADVSGLVDGHVDLVRSLAPDIVLLQEAAREIEIDAPLYASAWLRDLRPNSPSQKNATDRDLLGQLAKKLKDYRFFFAPAIHSNRDSHPAKWRRMGVPDGSLRAQGAAMGVRRETVKVLDFWTSKERPEAEPIELPLPLPEGETIYRGDRSSEPRIAQGLLIEIGHRELQVWNIHFTTLKGEREGKGEIDAMARKTRSAQLDVLFGALWTPGPSGPWIMGGDFNADWEELGHAITDRQPAAELIFAGPTRPNTSRGHPRPQADNILVGRAEFRVRERRILIGNDPVENDDDPVDDDDISLDKIGRTEDRNAMQSMPAPRLELSPAYADTIKKLRKAGVDHFPLLLDLSIRP